MDMKNCPKCAAVMDGLRECPKCGYKMRGPKPKETGAKEQTRPQVLTPIFQGNRGMFKTPVDFCVWTQRPCVEESWALDETVPQDKWHNPPFDCRDCIQRRKSPGYREGKLQ
jgi:Zn ribbon nucleic-acid-binding protein